MESEALFAISPPLFRWSDCEPSLAPSNEYIVNGLIRRRGTNLVLSAPKKGKSQLVAHLTACLIGDRPVFGHYEIAQGFEPRILLILTEENRFKARDRIDKNLRGLGYSASDVQQLAESFEERLLVSARDKSRGRNVEDMLFNVERHGQWLLDQVRDELYNVVVLDSLRPAHPFEENSSTAMRPVTDLMRELSEYGCGLIIHHTGHVYEGSRRSGGDAARGSSDLDAARDTAIHIGRGCFGGSMLIGFHHRDDAERFVAVETEVSKENHCVTWTRTGESEDPGAVRWLVQEAELLARIDAATRPDELPTKTQANAIFGDSYNQILATLEMEGAIVGRTFRSGGPGAPSTRFMRPGQFSNKQWEEAERRAREES
jgi:hypothetical protein